MSDITIRKEANGNASVDFKENFLIKLKAYGIKSLPNITINLGGEE